MKHPLQSRLEQCCVATIARLASLLARLPLRWVWRIADIGAWFVLRSAPRRQRLADANLAAVFPDLSARERRQIIRRSVRGISRTMAELFMLPRLSAADLERLIETPDLTTVREAVQSGCGVIFITAHFGNWEFMGAHAAHLLAPLTVVARDAPHPGSAGLINAARESHGVRVIGERDAWAMMRVLKSGGLLGVLPDQHALESGTVMDFLGRPAWTYTGPALLAARTGARVFAGFCVRELDGSFHLEMPPEIKLVDSGDREADVLTNTRLITAVIEDAIRRHPDNWLWLHNRWKEPRAQRAPAQ